LNGLKANAMTLPYGSKLTPFFVEKNATQVNNLFVATNSILQARTTNLNVVKNYVGGVLGKPETKPDSYYTYLVRVFNNEEVDQLGPCLLLAVFFLLNEKIKIKYLTLDGTSWEFGDQYIHILTLCVLYEGVSIPIWWKDLGHKGVSSQKEREDFMKEALERYNLKGMILLADREYFGEIWFNFLQENGIHFIIRLKREAYRTLVDAYLLPFDEQSGRYKHFQNKRYSYLFKLANTPKYQNVGVAKFIKILNRDYLFVMYKNPNVNVKEEDKMLFFISTLNKKEQVIKAYPLRWTIECCFKHLKSNGFNLETMNVKGSIKQNLMMTILVFLYTFSIVQGLILQPKKNRKFKKFKNDKTYLAVSIFKKGNDTLISTIISLKLFYLCLAKIMSKTNPYWVIF
jgi:hypothetical protein